MVCAGADVPDTIFAAAGGCVSALGWQCTVGSVGVDASTIREGPVQLCALPAWAIRVTDDYTRMLQELMERPMMTACGHTFDRGVIQTLYVASVIHLCTLRNVCAPLSLLQSVVVSAARQFMAKHSGCPIFANRTLGQKDVHRRGAAPCQCVH